MRVHRGDFIQPPPGATASTIILTMGNFDGLHRGHEFLIKQLLVKAESKGLEPAVLTFEPHPGRYFKGSEFPLPLQTEVKRLERFAKLGIAVLLIQDFSPQFAQVSAEDFLRQYLLQSLRPAWVVLGYNFRYGQNSQGDFALASRLLGPASVVVEQAEALVDEKGAISSTRVRDLLGRGQVEDANQLLGYVYSLQGQVVHGRQLGRQLGFPTANLGLITTLLPAKGVYAGWAQVGATRHPALVNIGDRPTLEGPGGLSCEVHLLDFQGDLYGQTLEFHFIKRLREERKFPNLEALKNQIQQDVDDAKRFL